MALALDLLQGLHDISKEKNLNNFELVLRISQEKAQRWDAEYLRRQLENWNKDSGIEKVYVCGPPKMNEMFDRTIDEIVRDEQMAKTYGISRPKINML